MRLTTVVKNRFRSAFGYDDLQREIRRLETLILRATTVAPATGNSTAPVAPANPEDLKKALAEKVERSAPGSALSCRINGMDLTAPVEALRMYPHCLHPDAEQELTYFIETRQSDWLCSKLRPGDTAFDVGSSVGLISLAMARTVTPSGRVYAFEPSRGAYGCLGRFVEMNGLSNITAVAAAVAAEAGAAEFIEYHADKDLTWAAEISTLATPGAQDRSHTRYEVPVTTIDQFCHSTGAAPRAVKIDIEGFEIDALQGGQETIRARRPFLCIDIHTDSRTGESSRGVVESFLGQLNYTCRMEGHAMYAEPAPN